MLLVEIGTAGAISAYFYRHITSDPIERQPVQLSDYLFVFGCGLVFWLLVLLRAKLHGSGDRQADIRKVAKLAKLIAPITTLNLCGCLQAPFMKLPLLVRFLVLFQVSSNLALLLIWAFLSLKECMIVRDAHTQQQQQESSPEPQAVQQQKPPPEPQAVQQQKPLHQGPNFRTVPSVTYWADPIRCTTTNPPSELQATSADNCNFNQNLTAGYPVRVFDDTVDVVVTNVAGKIRVVAAEQSAGGKVPADVGKQTAGGKVPADVDGGGDRGASGSEHDSGASGSGGGREGGDKGRDGDGADLECGGRRTNTEQDFENSEIIKMSLALTAQTTGTLMGFHLTPTPSSSSKVLLVVALMDQLVAYLCGVTGILLSSNKPKDLKAAKIFAGMGLVCSTLGYILMIAMYVAMYVPWYSVLIVVLLFGVVWLILFRNGLKTRATEVWDYLRRHAIYKELHRDAI